MSNLANAVVIFNPASGRGRAKAEIQRALRFFRRGIQLQPSQHAGHGEQLACLAAQSGHSPVIAAGGDGTVHEVANGLLQLEPVPTHLGIWPIGSANDYAWALGLTEWWQVRQRQQACGQQLVDVGIVSAPDGRQRYFVNGLGLGINAGVTLEARKIPWLRGMPLYGMGIARALYWHYQDPVMRIRFDDTEVHGRTLALTVNLGRKEGGFPITPQASLTDGLFDCVRIQRLSAFEIAQLLPRLVAGTLPSDHPKLTVCRARTVQVQSEAPLRIHLDGEFFCEPDEGIHEVEIRLLPARLRVECFPKAPNGGQDRLVRQGRPAGDEPR